ncbi:hypothetical protein C8T65DRAFT_600853 [Cerioporus squamosus]|nr:hypothetical protein C8T65DRAFT_600853 [Cerioporus squamosus]
MHIEKLKVRPRQATAVRPCTTQFASMLACWSATGDVMSTSACAESAKQLLTCMRTAPAPTRKHKPTINYHLARLGKTLN